MYSISPNIFGESGVYQITYKSLYEFEQLRERRVAEEAGLPLSHKTPQWNNEIFYFLLSLNYTTSIQKKRFKWL